MAAATPESVKALTCPTSGYAVKLSENSCQLEFLEFRINDQASGNVFFEVQRDQAHQLPTSSLPDIPPEVEDMVRHVRYSVPKKMLQCKVIETRLKFSLGQDVSGLRLIERHYFKGIFIKEYDIQRGPCKAGGGHSWNVEYAMPEASPEQIAEYVDTPGGHSTDSFYFVGDQLVVHNKATFTYVEDTELADVSDPQASTATVPGAVEDSAKKATVEADALADEMGQLQSA